MRKMRSDIIYQNKKKIYWIIGAVIGIYLLYGMILGSIYCITYNNGQTVTSLLEDISYTEDRADQEIKKLEACIEDHYLSEHTRGMVYKALAELSYMTGDDMLYNRYVATALFYLEEDGDSDSVVYLTNKYMGRLYANGCYQEAEELLESLAEKYEISSFSSEMQASYYLSRADLCQMLENPTDEYLQQAQDAILFMSDSKEKKLNQAKSDLLTARYHMLHHQWEEAERIIANYSETDSFGYETDQVYVVCDFKIPFEELMTKISLNQNDLSSAKKYMNAYLDLCEQYQFRTMELRLLQYVNDHSSMQGSADSSFYAEKEKEVLQKNLNELTKEYAQILRADMENTRNNLRQEKNAGTRMRRYLFIGSMVLSALFVICMIISILWDYVTLDGLTKLSNRKKYESLRLECDRKKTPYGFLMIDIDDFKKVNDTLGHDQGDTVLSGIAAILSRYTGRGIYAFRYGGEEMCMMFLNVPKNRVLEIAEEIRSKVEQTQFVDHLTVTISGGLSMSEHGENVFVSADRKLYEAKGSGKNRICS